MLTSSPSKTTQFHAVAFSELMETYRQDFLSDIYIGWAQGFLDGERAKLENALKGATSLKITLGHPASQIREFAKALASTENGAWYV